MAKSGSGGSAVRLVFIGDVALGESPSSAGLGVSRFLGSALYSQWRGYLSRFSADFVLGNFEGTVANGSDYATDHIMYGSMRVDPESAGLLGVSGISHLSLANNHSNDHGRRALEGSMDYLRSQGIITMEHFWPHGKLYEVGDADLSIGIIALNFVNKSMGRADDAIAVCARDIPALTELIRESRQRVDHLIATVHWGENYGLWPTCAQTDLARQFVEAGASAIIGHHPHNIQAVTTIGDVPVVYSLGSFCFENKSPFTRLGQVVAIDCRKDALSIADHRHISIGDDHGIGENLSVLQRLIVFLARQRPVAGLNFAFVRTVRAWILVVTLVRTLRSGNAGRYLAWIRHRYARARSVD